MSISDKTAAMAVIAAVSFDGQEMVRSDSCPASMSVISR